MIASEKFLTMSGKYTQAERVAMEDVLFGAGLDLSSIGFTEFIMALEEEETSRSTSTIWMPGSGRSGSFMPRSMPWPDRHTAR